MEYTTEQVYNKQITTHVMMGNTYFKCNYCEKFYDEVWINKSQTLCCCRHCWGNNPIVARATLGKPFRPQLFIQ